MIYLFIWENYFRKKLINFWKKAFKEKYNEHNIINILNVFDYDFSFYEQNLLWNSFFSERIFFVINNFPFSWDENDDLNSKKITEYFINILHKIPKENIIIFNNEKVDKRSKLYKEILKIWEVKDFFINDKNDLLQKLKNEYKDKISENALQKIIELKWLNFWNIVNELNKIFITKDYIDISDLDLITKDIEESIFEIMNDILSDNIKNAILKLRILSNFLDNPYLLYNNLVSNFRPYFYIFKLKLLWKSNIEIKNILNLWNRTFLVDRNYKININKFVKIYYKISSIDWLIKTWKLLWNENAEIMYEIEKSLII